MNVDYLIQVLERKVIILNNGKAQAFAVGDLDTLNAVDQELLSVQTTLTQLNMLASVNQAAAAGNTSTAAMLSGAISASQVPGTDVINGYDLSTYATDPLYEEKIEGILASMPGFSSADDISSYIQSIAQGSPITGQMVFDAATTYNVDEPLLVAIMQNDSQFGTQGVAVTTFNPGNVGNTGTSTQTYASWDDGVAAVAAWLANHRVAVPDAPVPTAVAPMDNTATTTDQTPIIPPPTDPNPVLPPTPPVLPPTDPGTGTTTPPVIIPPPDTTSTSTDPTASTTPPTDSTSTSTPDTTATSTSP